MLFKTPSAVTLAFFARYVSSATVIMYHLASDSSKYPSYPYCLCLIEIRNVQLLSGLFRLIDDSDTDKV